MGIFVLFCIIVGSLIGALIGKNISASKAKNYASKYPVNAPSAVDIWWKNLKHTPLSALESKQIAERAAKWYVDWKFDHRMDHSWLCLGIEESKISFKQLYSKSDGFKAAPVLTVAYPHTISCQNDRELLASYILSAIRAKDPGCKLFLDGDSLILPTNSR